MPKETKSVAKRGEADLPIALDQLEGMSGQGFEDSDKDAYAIPFLRLLQGLSPQVNEDDPDVYIQGAKPGMFFNTITGALFGKSINVIPVHYMRDFVEWKPNRGGFVKSHGPDPSILDRITEIDEKNNSILDNGNIIQDSRNHYILIEGHLDKGPIIFGLSSSGIKHSRKWMTFMNALKLPGSDKTAPMFAGVWNLASVLNKNDDGTWYQIGDKTKTAVEFQRWVTQEELEAAVAARKLITSGAAKADYAGQDDDLPF